jgi:hypothetical protein
MRKFASDTRDGNKVFVELTKEEWETLQRASGIPYDKRNETVVIDVNNIANAVSTLIELKDFRKPLGKLQSTWDKLATEIDKILQN